MARSYIIATALEDELKGFGTYAPIVYTGIGKINATLHLYEGIKEHSPDLVINFGTAGALTGKKGFMKADTIIQHDMDARALGFARGVTPFSDKELPERKGVVLGSGDRFVDDPKQQLDGLSVLVDLVDMEAFALQAVCDHLNVEFVCYKYVSDNADTEASDKWKETVSDGAGLFEEFLAKEYGKSALLAD